MSFNLSHSCGYSKQNSKKEASTRSSTCQTGLLSKKQASIVPGSGKYPKGVKSVI